MRRHIKTKQRWKSTAALQHTKIEKNYLFFFFVAFFLVAFFLAAFFLVAIILLPRISRQIHFGELMNKV
jgi:hypothetical protein